MLSKGDSITTLLAEQAGYAFIGSFIERLLRFGGVSIITYMISPKIFGAYTLAAAIISLISRFSGLNLDQSIDYFVPKYISSGEYGKVKYTIYSTIIVSFISSILVTLLVYINIDILQNYLSGSELKPFFLVMLISIVIFPINAILYKCLNSYELVEFTVLVKNIIKPLIQYGTSIILVFLGADILGLAIGYVLAVFLSLIILAYFLFTKTNNTSHNISKTSLRKMISYSLPLLLAGGLYALISKMDTLLIGYFLQSEQIGYYRISYILAGSILIFHGSFTPILKPLMSKVQGDGNKLQYRYRLATRWAVLFSLPPAITLIIAPKEYLMIIFSDQYAVAYNVLRLLILGFLFSILTGSVNRALEATGRPNFHLINTIVMLVTNLIVGILLIPRYGILGAAAGTTMALIMTNTLGVLEIYHFEGIQPFTSGMVKSLISGILTAIVGVIVFKLPIAGTVKALILPIAISLLYLIFLITFNSFTADDVEIAERVDSFWETHYFSYLIRKGTKNM